MTDHILKYFLGELTKAEEIDLLKKVRIDESLEKEFIRIQNTYALTNISEFAKDEQEGKESFDKFYKKIEKKKKLHFVRKVMRYAAIAVALISSTLFLTYYMNFEKQSEMVEVHVPVGQRARITLQDGTVVWLNSRSTLKYPSQFSDKERKVELIGEGFFDVAKDKSKPFVVSSQRVDMKVLGTQFNVYSYPETGYLQTDLIEGLLKVYWKDSEPEGVVIHPNERILAEHGKLTVSNIQNMEHLLWKDGIYAFDNEKLTDIVEKLQLYYDVKIVLNNSQIANMRYTGKFRQRDDIDGILHIIQKVHPFNIEKNEEKNTITLD